ncbi:Rieske 2Fe-2S domain-containing protein [Cohnella fermenti]|uniref:Rieske (2Fe-2S) protein n=1 Tax=Cohnella fermenti TaxID=2565925 RepID=A0A4S4BFI9_9BACL|nr:Rieske 2Fe-2S domain-containing protein [Cohnella fermenti]THF73096.1 Rieske (2Fe-2S) protein [Cohnella fermenti]
MTKFPLGPVALYTSFPTEVNVDCVPYWLVREGEGGYRLLLALCPHAGGEIRWTGEQFLCPLHFWTFDEHGGCLNVRDERLVRRDVELKDGILYAVGDNY